MMRITLKIMPLVTTVDEFLAASDMRGLKHI